MKDYQWSSYPIFAGYKKALGWLETGWLLSLFGNNRKRYRQFVEGAQKERVPNPSKDAVHGLILGSVEFVDWIQTTFIAKMANSREKPQLKNLKLGLEADRIIQFVCDEFGCEKQTIIQKGSKKNIARDVAIYLSRQMTGDSCVALGQRFGGICGAGITVRCNHLKNQLERDRKLKRQVSKLKGRIIKMRPRSVTEDRGQKAAAPAEAYVKLEGRMKIITKCLWLCCIISLVSCGSPIMKRAVPLNSPCAGKALVTFIMSTNLVKVFTRGYQIQPIEFDIWDENRFLGALSTDTYFQVLAEPGEHLYIAKGGNWSFVKATVKAGKKYYLYLNIYPRFIDYGVVLQPIKESEEWIIAEIPNTLEGLEPISVMKDKREKYESARCDEVKNELRIFNSTDYSFSILEPQDGI